MRIFITDKAMNLRTLASSLARSARNVDALLERVKISNPQLSEAQTIPAGTAVILPETPDLKPDVGQPPGADLHADLRATLRSGLRDLDNRAARHAERLAAEHTALREALKPAAVKRLLESDPRLQAQIAAAETQFKADQERAAKVRAQMKEAAKVFEAGLAKLQNLFG